MEPAGRAVARQQRDGGPGGQTPCRSPAGAPGRGAGPGKAGRRCRARPGAVRDAGLRRAVGGTVEGGW